MTTPMMNLQDGDRLPLDVCMIEVLLVECNMHTLGHKLPLNFTNPTAICTRNIDRKRVQTTVSDGARYKHRYKYGLHHNR